MQPSFCIVIVINEIDKLFSSYLFRKELLIEEKSKGGKANLFPPISYASKI